MIVSTFGVRGVAARLARPLLGETKTLVSRLHPFSESQNQWQTTNHAGCIEQRSNTTLGHPAYPPKENQHMKTAVLAITAVIALAYAASAQNEF